MRSNFAWWFQPKFRLVTGAREAKLKIIKKKRKKGKRKKGEKEESLTRAQPITEVL